MTDATVTAVSTAMFSAIPPTIAALAVLVTALRTKKAVQELHLAVNSRLTQLLDQTSKASRAEGVVEGTKTATENK
jgi:hypothetical protein